jgi:hypothetical protein
MPCIIAARMEKLKRAVLIFEQIVIVDVYFGMLVLFISPCCT